MLLGLLLGLLLLGMLLGLLLGMLLGLLLLGLLLLLLLLGLLARLPFGDCAALIVFYLGAPLCPGGRNRISRSERRRGVGTVCQLQY